MTVTSNIKWKSLLINIAIPLAIGGIASLIVNNGFEKYSEVTKPALSPPPWIFPVVWTILYTLMGISSYLILTSEKDKKEIQKALTVYAYQLVVNFLWPTFFFNFGWYLFAFVWLVLLWVLVFLMVRQFHRVDKLAALLQIPSLIWLTFAAYLNFGVWVLNR